MDITVSLTAKISIHALHEESDPACRHATCATPSISIHALHEESDRRRMCVIFYDLEFQSTLSMRRATIGVGPMPSLDSYFNPRSP